MVVIEFSARRHIPPTRALADLLRMVRAVRKGRPATGMQIRCEAGQGPVDTPKTRHEGPRVDGD
jgi:hypothetical protein